MRKIVLPPGIDKQLATLAFLTAFVPWAKQLEKRFTGTSEELRRAVIDWFVEERSAHIRGYPERAGHVTRILTKSATRAWLRREGIQLFNKVGNKRATVWTVTPPAKKPGATEETSWVEISLHIPLALMNFIRNKATEEGQTLSAALTNAILHYKADLEQTGEPTINVNHAVLTRDDLSEILAETLQDYREFAIEDGKDDSARIMKIEEEIGNMAEVHSRWNHDAKQHREAVTKTLAIIQGFVERIYERVTRKWWQRK